MSNLHFGAIEAYANHNSVRAGSVIAFHVSVTDATAPSGQRAVLEIFRSAQFSFDNTPLGLVTSTIYGGDFRLRMVLDAEQQPVHNAQFAPANHVAITPDNASRNGCNWPVAVSWRIPRNTKSGVFIARFSWKGTYTYTLFVVRPLIAGVFDKIVCQLSVNTYQAYNLWGGQCFYDFGETPLDQVSFDRPCQLWDYILYDQPIVAWLERNFPHAEYCTNTDLHEDAVLLNPYQLFISCGHDEYWSAAMRDRIEAFVESYGNTLFLGGNICYREATPVGRVLIKNNVGTTDAVWRNLKRPEAYTIGLSFSGGRWSQVLPRVGYLARRSAHWAFEGTGLLDGRDFGQREGIIGYETDAANYDNGRIAAPTPANFVALAEVALPEWTDNGLNARATFGLYRRGEGVIVAAGTTGWGQGLIPNDFEVHQITRNLVSRLRRRAIFGNIYAVSPEGNLCWYRDRLQNGMGDVGPAKIIASGWGDYKFVFCGGEGVIYTVTQEGNLLWYKDESRDGNVLLSGPAIIGYGGWAGFRHAFSGGNGIIYAVTPDGNLCFYKDERRDGTGDVSGIQIIGQGGWDTFLQVFSGGYGIIYAITAEGNLVWYRDYSRDGTGNVGNGRTIGYGGWNGFRRVFGGDDGILYAVTNAGDLLWYKDFNRDGTGEVGSPATIGHGGWDGMRWIEGELF